MSAVLLTELRVDTDPDSWSSERSMRGWFDAMVKRPSLNRGYPLSFGIDPKHRDRLRFNNPDAGNSHYVMFQMKGLGGVDVDVRGRKVDIGRSSWLDPAIHKVLTALVTIIPEIKPWPVEGHARGRGGGPTFTVADVLTKRGAASRLMGHAKIPVLYHGTSSSHAQEIMRGGLVPRKDTGLKTAYGSHKPSNEALVYFTDALGIARRAASAVSGKRGGWPVVFEVRIPDPTKLRPDEDAVQFYGDDWRASLAKFGNVAYEGRVPPSRIKPLEWRREREPGDEDYDPEFPKRLAWWEPWNGRVPTAAMAESTEEIDEATLIDIPGVKRIVDTERLRDGDNPFGNAAAARSGYLFGWHTTDDPKTISDILSKRVPLQKAGGKSGDMGAGFYVSAVPRMWVNRSTGKWSFLDKLNKKQVAAVAEKLLAEIVGNPRYSENEQRYAARDIGHVVDGDIATSYLSRFGGMPYGIPFWEERWLKPLGIEPSQRPVSIKIKARGRFAEVDSSRTALSAARRLKRAGVAGAFVRGGFSDIAQMVIWDPRAIVEVGRPELIEARGKKKRKRLLIAKSKRLLYDKRVSEANDGGDCYEAAVTYIMEHGTLGLRRQDGDPDLILVHGEVLGQGPLEGVRYGHAWIEKGPMVIDTSNGRNVRMPTMLYYALGQIDRGPSYPNVYKYTAEQVREKLLEHGHYGPWDLKTSSGL